MTRTPSPRRHFAALFIAATVLSFILCFLDAKRETPAETRRLNIDDIRREMEPVFEKMRDE